MNDFLMPSLGADMEAGTVVEWRVGRGQQVKHGDVVAVVETAKGAIEIEIFESGVIAEIMAPVGAKVPVGAPLARLNPAAGMVKATPLPSPPRAPAAVVASPPRVEPLSSGAGSLPVGGRVRSTPAAKRRAAELGMSLLGLKGSGEGGAVSLADVESTARDAPRKTSPRGLGGAFDPTAMRKAIAAAMARSKREIPHYYLSNSIDLGRTTDWLVQTNRDRPPAERLLPGALFLKATALALSKSPELNGFWENDGFRAADGIHVGWAVALRGGGLIAAAVLDADRRPLPEIMAAMRDLVQRARSGGLRSSELASPTITVSSLGERGAETVLPVIYPPQVASVGFGRVVRRPWVIGEDAIAVRPVVMASLAGDHRASDGHQGGLFLAELERLLQTPEAL
jgi:pyruvate dehydrogenase E2 component (dihydrolipoamide acetyltransferase)